jgi:hypothetical protein
VTEVPHIDATFTPYVLAAKLTPGTNIFQISVYGAYMEYIYSVDLSVIVTASKNWFNS